jgi:hypothetical protein
MVWLRTLLAFGILYYPYVLAIQYANGDLVLIGIYSGIYGMLGAMFADGLKWCGFRKSEDEDD